MKNHSVVSFATRPQRSCVSRTSCFKTHASERARDNPTAGNYSRAGPARACSAEWRAAAVSTSQTAVGTVHRQRHATRRTLRLAAVVRCRAGRRVPSRRTPHAGARALSARVAWWHGRHGTRWITRRSLRSLAAACRGRYVVTLIVRLQRVSSGNRPRSGPLAFADLPACLE